MFGIPLPWLLVGLCITLFGTYRGGYHFGWSDRDREMQIEIARKNDESRQTEQKLNEQLNTTASKLLEVNNVVTQKQSALDRAIRDGRVRFPSASCPSTTTNPTIASADTKATSQPDRQADSTSDSDRASEADRETLAAIAEIVAQGDRNTAALNACVDSYNQMRDLLNDKR
jgi:hypothetical protein